MIVYAYALLALAVIFVLAPAVGRAEGTIDNMIRLFILFAISLAPAKIMGPEYIDAVVLAFSVLFAYLLYKFKREYIDFEVELPKVERVIKKYFG